MARLPRLTVPGFPHHVIQRGNNRQATFLDDADYRLFLDLLAEYAPAHGVAIHAYVLMPNHFHLLATPRDEAGLPATMQAAGRRYVQAFNRRHGRTGTLWEGRYRGTVVQTEPYLLACMAYIELNPVRAGLVSRPEDYPWSSYRHHAGLSSDRLIVPHALYWGLGNTPFAREAAYAERVAEGIRTHETAALTESALKGWALGGPDFIEHVRRQTGRRPERQRAGRRPGLKDE